METAVVIDASVWVSWFIGWDANHNASHVWMQRYITGGGQLVAPAFLLIEVAAAISRQIRQPLVTRDMIRNLYNVPAMHFRSPDLPLFWSTIEIAADLQLRAGDAIYVALARRFNLPLVSWDREQVERARGLTTTYTPSNYVFHNGETEQS